MHMKIMKQAPFEFSVIRLSSDTAFGQPAIIYVILSESVSFIVYGIGIFHNLDMNTFCLCLKNSLDR